MNFIKNILFAYTICKKYGFKVKWKISGYSASALWNVDTGFRLITISPFHKTFKQTFLHEVSHLLSYNRIYKRGLSVQQELSCPVNTFKEETKAWLFAKRVLKSEYDPTTSKCCLMTYSRVHYYEDVKVDKIHEYTDNFIKCMNRV